ncbi:hypothetical protein OSB04_031557 [Centaurea solstitialis]|uniref:Uncharacterized protein n=1 Tax=Centaurea solstitialis TaxID=347529 RepID=A0AA38SAZ0_9ASTR|nr:hypothetical protein OSB04_031557 [Centaurea solstitialis]
MSQISIPFYSPEESLRLIMGKWKLTGHNFPVWKLHLRNVLCAQDKLYVINKPVSRPKSNAPEEEFAEYFRYLTDESDVMSILIFSMSPEFTGDLRVKSCHEVVRDVENQLGLYKHTGKLLIMQEILSLKLQKGQSVKNHLVDMRRLFKCLSRLGYKMTQEELVYLMWFSLTKEVQDTASAYMKEPKSDVDKVHEDILASLEPVPEPANLMDTDIVRIMCKTDWILDWESFLLSAVHVLVSHDSQQWYQSHFLKPSDQPIKPQAPLYTTAGDTTVSGSRRLSSRRTTTPHHRSWMRPWLVSRTTPPYVVAVAIDDGDDESRTTVFVVAASVLAADRRWWQ